MQIHMQMQNQTQNIFTIKDNTIQIKKKNDTNYNISVKDIKPLFVNKYPPKMEKYGYNDKYDDTKMKRDKNWNTFKLLSNPYTFISLSGADCKLLKSVGLHNATKISNVKAISAAYFKLWEMIIEFNLLSVNNDINMAGIAEGPGGFINAMVDYRKQFYKDVYLRNSVAGITLIDRENPKPYVVFEEHKPAQNFMKEYRNEKKILKISHGKNGTGNINVLDNILEFAKLYEGDNRAYFASADGGIDTEGKKNIQEQLSSQLVFNEIVTILSIQAIGGNSVIKCYFLTTELSAQCLYLLCCLYDEVYITKPVTSKITNFEEYIVCKGFKGIDTKLLHKLYEITDKWQHNATKNVNKVCLLSSMLLNDVPDDFANKLAEYNKKMFDNKMKYNDKTMELIKKANDNGFKNSRNISGIDGFFELVNEGKKIARQWCINYKINYIKNGENNGINKRRY